MPKKDYPCTVTGVGVFFLSNWLCMCNKGKGGGGVGNETNKQTVCTTNKPTV